MRKYPFESCEHHPDKSLELFCFSDKALLGMMCIVEQHSGHQCANIKRVADDYLKEIEEDKETISTGLAKCRGNGMRDQLTKDKDSLTAQITKADLHQSRRAARDGCAP